MGEADHLMGNAGEPLSCVGPTHGHREDEPSGVTAAQRAERGDSGDTRREAVVDQHDIAILHIGQRPSTSIALDSALEFSSFPRGELGEPPARQTERVQRGLIGENLPAFGDRANSQLALSGSPDLPGDEHVERSTQGLRDLERNRHPTARERQNHRVVQAQSGEAFRELPACVASVLEAHVQPTHHESDDLGRFLPGTSRRYTGAGGNRGAYKGV